MPIHLYLDLPVGAAQTELQIYNVLKCMDELTIAQKETSPKAAVKYLGTIFSDTGMQYRVPGFMM